MAVAKTFKLDKSGGIDLKPGSELGLLLSVVHLGTQRNTWQGSVSLVDKLLFRFELQDVLTEKGHPVVVSKIERNSMKSKANVTKLVKAMGVDVSEGCDFEELVGKPVMVNMDYNNDKTKVGVKGFSLVPNSLKKTVKPLMGTPQVLLDVEEISDSQKQELPEWVRKVIDERVKDGGSSEPNSAIDL